MTRILITGGTGQLGFELARVVWPEDVEVVFPNRAALDLGDCNSIAAIFERGPWDAVVNSAAYTAVDAAEDDVANAFLYNAQGAAWLAEGAHKVGANFVQISTDYVFDGSALDPYREDSSVSPIGAYGASKLAGEFAVRAAHPHALVLRTAWVLGVHGNNFLKTRLRLGADRPHLRVVADQRGCPTSAADIAQAVRTIVMRQLSGPGAPTGVHHFVNAGEASWCELARTIFELAGRYGAPTPEVAAIGTADYPTRARRPTNSRLDTSLITANFGIVPRAWQDAVAEIVDELCANQRPSVVDANVIGEIEA